MNICRSFIHNYQKLEATEMSSGGEQINKLQYVYAVEYYSAILKNMNFGFTQQQR